MIITIERDKKSGDIELVYLLESSRADIKKIRSLTLLDEASSILNMKISNEDYVINRSRNDLIEISGELYKISIIRYEKRRKIDKGYW